MPAAASISSEDVVRFRALSVSEVMASLEGADCEASIVVIDACRGDFATCSAWRSLSCGLAQIPALRPANSITVYAAKPGQIAKDGLFTPLPRPLRSVQK